MTLDELIEEMKKLPQGSRISIEVEEPPASLGDPPRQLMPTTIRITIQAAVKVRIFPWQERP